MAVEWRCGGCGCVAVVWRCGGVAVVWRCGCSVEDVEVLL